MGSVHSSSVAGSKGTELSTKNPSKHVFVWKINGFTALLDQGEVWTSTSFQVQGFTWIISMHPMDRKSGDKGSEKHMSLGLAIAPFCISPNYMLETKFKFLIHDQQGGKHVEREVSHTYLNTCRRSNALCMIPLLTLKNPSLGFLINDTIAVGVELIKIKKVPRTGLERITILQRKQPSGSYSWYIEDFFKLTRPIALSESFQIAGYTWRLRLEPESIYDKNYVGLYLTLENKSGSHHPTTNGVMINAVLSIKNQPKGAYQKKFCYNFTTSSTISLGYSQFIKLEDFKNPSNGYLIKGTCTIEVSLSNFGFANDRSC